jgi:hypothetical protein
LAESNARTTGNPYAFVINSCAFSPKWDQRLSKVNDWTEEKNLAGKGEQIESLLWQELQKLEKVSN